jgi:hypothetical protein
MIMPRHEQGGGTDIGKKADAYSANITEFGICIAKASKKVEIQNAKTF